MKKNIPLFLNFYGKKEAHQTEQPLYVSSKKLQTSKMEIIRSYKKSSNFRQHEQ